ncbi:hypothetical protein PR003_g23592 [Phytophthora rubi]|uniref:Uncharacterized protein n=1 Tax=Phytophthora rubi TaxID=129364 RepID=A0A6A3JWV1_9STRA|nr:hypothetical protein PR002_g18786 [Phytophthora rubi]KAE9297085.1 hypothetical protein PR003_g23592 [Phytophthora rubi]
MAKAGFPVETSGDRKRRSGEREGATEEMLATEAEAPDEEFPGG